MEEFSIAQINHFILQKQHLTSDTKTDDILQITRNIGGLHATSQSSTYLSLVARTNNFSKTDLEKEVYEEKNLGKIRCMRKTIFIQPKESIPFIYTATKGQYTKRQEDYLKNLGVSFEEYNKSADEIKQILRGRTLSTADIKKELTSEENAAHFITLMCDQLDIIRNKPVKSWRDKRHTYSLFSEYFPKMGVENISEEGSRESLVKLYLESLGPSSETDIVWWTGFNKTQTRKILQNIESLVSKITIEGIDQEYYILADELNKLKKTDYKSKNVVNLLPDLDPYLMGFKDRERYVKEEFYNYVYDRSGNATLSILLNGKVIGIWDFVSSKESRIKIFFLEKPESAVKEMALKEVKRVGEFIFEEETSITECKEMEPLKGRIPGEVLIPLKQC